jgi:hypothetical protein
MSPHPKRQAAPPDESDDAQCHFHRLHWHPALEKGRKEQPGGVWRLSKAYKDNWNDIFGKKKR